MAASLGRRNSELRKSNRVPVQSNPASKGSMISEQKKHGSSGKKKMQNKSKMNGETTPSNLARQLLQNLNIFSHKSTNNVSSHHQQHCDNRTHKECVLDADSSSTKSGTSYI